MCIRDRPRDVPLSYGDREVLLRFTACGLVGVLLEYGRKPNMDLYHEMGAAFERVVQAGDCIAGGSILEATRTGNDNVWFL